MGVYVVGLNAVQILKQRGKKSKENGIYLMNYQVSVDFYTR